MLQPLYFLLDNPSYVLHFVCDLVPLTCSDYTAYRSYATPIKSCPACWAPGRQRPSLRITLLGWSWSLHCMVTTPKEERALHIAAQPSKLGAKCTTASGVTCAGWVLERVGGKCRHVRHRPLLWLKFPDVLCVNDRIQLPANMRLS
jgi:hypothetical protein